MLTYISIDLIYDNYFFIYSDSFEFWKIIIIQNIKTNNIKSTTGYIDDFFNIIELTVEVDILLFI